MKSSLKNILIIPMVVSMLYPQGLMGLAGKAQEKIKQINDDIKNQASKLVLIVDSTFANNSSHIDFKKGLLKKPVRTMSPSKEDENKKDQEEYYWAGKRHYKNFGDIGSDMTINNLRQGNFNPKVESKSSCNKKTVSRFYSFEITESSQNTVCECTAETTKKTILPFLNLFVKFEQKLNCTIYNSADKYELELDYKFYKKNTSLNFKQQFIANLIPRHLIDDGKRFSLTGSLTNSTESYSFSTSYNFDWEFLKSNPLSALKMLKPSIGYILKDKNNQTALIKNPSHFRINDSYIDSEVKGILYGAILSAYFYKPLHNTYKTNNLVVNSYAINPVAYSDILAQHESDRLNNKGKTKIIYPPWIDAEEAKQMQERQKQNMDTMSKTIGEMSKLGFGGPNSEYRLPIWKNERGYLLQTKDGNKVELGMDIYYDALIRGPLGLW